MTKATYRIWVTEPGWVFTYPEIFNTIDDAKAFGEKLGWSFEVIYGPDVPS